MSLPEPRYELYERQGFESISHVPRNGHKQRELYTKMPEVLMRYTKANGAELEGLRVRRQKEEFEVRGRWSYGIYVNPFVFKKHRLMIGTYLTRKAGIRVWRNPERRRC